MISWLLKILAELAADIINGILNLVGSAITLLFENIAEINLKNEMVVGAADFTMYFALALVSLVTVYKYFTIYILETDGDHDVDPLEMWVRLSQAVLAICSSGTIFQLLMLISKEFTKDLLENAKVDNLENYIIHFVQGLLVRLTPVNAVFICIYLIMVIGLLIFCFMAGIRGTELSLMRIIFPIMACDLITSNRDRWRDFITSCIITFLGYSIQVLSFRMFTGALLQVSQPIFDTDFMIAFGWFVGMIRVPKWLEKYAYSSGILRTGGGAVRSLPMLLLKK
jgi:hypothetical protein